MTDRKTLAMIGAALLFVGVFLPLVSMPIIGNINYLYKGRGDGLIVLGLAIATALLVLTGRVRHILWTGLASLGVIAFSFVRLQSAMAEMDARMDEELSDNPFRGLAEAAMESIQIQWGWAILILGGLLVTYAGFMAMRDKVESSAGAAAAPNQSDDSDENL